MILSKIMHAMKLKKTGVFSAVTATVLLLISGSLSFAETPAAIQDVDEATRVKISENYGKLPLMFEANEGQTDDQVRFITRGQGYGMFFTPDELVLVLNKTENKGDRKLETKNRMKNPGVSDPSNQTPTTSKLRSSVVRMKLAGANPHPQMAGEKPLVTKTSYFIGNDKDKWRTGISNYGKVHYEEVYPGIDLVYYGNQRKLEYDFIVQPGADPKVIRMYFEGVDAMSVEAGELVLETPNGKIVKRAPVIYQEIDGQRKPIAGNYAFLDDGQVGFYLGSYNKTKALVIDPVLDYSTFLGGSGFGFFADEEGNNIVVDGSGAAYVAGVTFSSDFPTTAGAFDTTFNGGIVDAFVTKLDPAGANLLYSTYLGGINGAIGIGIALNGSGNAYVTGFTSSTDFPVTVGAFDTSFNGGSDVFVTRLNASGSDLDYSTFLGGTGADVGQNITVDSVGNAYVTGNTLSSDFPTTAGAFDTSHNGNEDVFVTRLNASGSDLDYSTYLGGTAFDGGLDIAVDDLGNAYVTGNTLSSDFPTTAGAFDTSHNGSVDGYVTRLNASGSSLDYSTYFGGTSSDNGLSINVDGAGNAYVAGFTFSSDFPTTAEAFDTSFNGSNEVFVLRLNASGSDLDYSTYLGGTGFDTGGSIAVDGAGNAWVTGQTFSPDFPTTPGAFDTSLNIGNGAFVTRLNASGSDLDYSTFLGRGARGQGIAVDGSGSVYVTGCTFFSGFPTTPGAFDTTYNGGNEDAFVAKFAKTAEDLLEELIELVLSQNFDPGIENPLLDTLEAALNVLGKTNGCRPATKILDAFIIIAEKKQISAGQEEDLVGLAQDIIDLLDCN